MLENIAAKPKLIQDDGLHPNALGQPMILENIWQELKVLLKK
jgi:acyl-CoA thioesterase-1